PIGFFFPIARGLVLPAPVGRDRKLRNRDLRGGIGSLGVTPKMPDQNHFIHTAASHDPHFTIRARGAPPRSQISGGDAVASRESTTRRILVSQLPVKRCMISFVSLLGRLPLVLGLALTLFLCA